MCKKTFPVFTYAHSFNNVPGLIAVSAGFDAYEGDPITSMGLAVSDFRVVGEEIKKLGKRTFSVLEGGYSQDLPELIFSYLISI